MITANFVVLPPSMKGVFPDFSVEMGRHTMFVEPMKVFNKCFHLRKFSAML